MEKTKPAFRRKIDFDIDDAPSRDVFADDETEAAPIVPTSKAKKRPDIEFEGDTRRIVAKTVDTVKDEQQAERQKIEDVMRRLNMTKQGTTPQPEEAETIAAAEKPRGGGQAGIPISAYRTFFKSRLKPATATATANLLPMQKNLWIPLKVLGCRRRL